MKAFIGFMVASLLFVAVSAIGYFAVGSPFQLKADDVHWEWEYRSLRSWTMIQTVLGILGAAVTFAFAANQAPAKQER